MAKDSQRLEQEFIATVAQKTGKSLDEWFTVIKSSGLDKSQAILKWLKEAHNLNHLQANFLQGLYLNGGQPVFDYDVLFKKLFEDKQALLPTYHALESAITQRLPDVELIPTKAYVSIEGKKIFACASPTAKLIRAGLDLGDTPFDDYVQKAKSLGAMPNLTHMIEIAAPSDVNAKFLGFVEQAYNRVHQK
ncbi:MAG: DUF5655 domain-containing protein [Anaerolineae bacterium]